MVLDIGGYYTYICFGILIMYVCMYASSLFGNPTLYDMPVEYTYYNIRNNCPTLCKDHISSTLAYCHYFIEEIFYHFSKNGKSF